MYLDSDDLYTDSALLLIIGRLYSCKEGWSNANDFVTHLLRQVGIDGWVWEEIHLTFEGTEGGKLEVATLILSRGQGRSRTGEELKGAKLIWKGN